MFAFTVLLIKLQCISNTAEVLGRKYYLLVLKLEVCFFEGKSRELLKEAIIDAMLDFLLLIENISALNDCMKFNDL